jgi:hypothetical protein
VSTADARHLWTLAEPLHALTYFAPEAHAAFEDAGLRGFWRGYFAGRAAPMGPVPAGPVTAVFFGFHPDFVGRAIPSIWAVIDPPVAIEARLDGVDRALRRILGSDLPVPAAGRAVAAMRAAIESTPVAGRPLYSANADLAWPESPHVALWHAVTLLREHRGDGHVSALTVAGIDPCEAHVLRIADDDLPIDSIQPYRGWREADWAEAADRLRSRGWLDEDCRTTTDGHEARARVEHDTDRLSAELVNRISDPDAVVPVLASINDRLRESGEIPYPNPIGVPPPAPG